MTMMTEQTAQQLANRIGRLERTLRFLVARPYTFKELSIIFNVSTEQIKALLIQHGLFTPGSGNRAKVDFETACKLDLILSGEIRGNSG